MFNRLKLVEQRFNDINEMLQDPQVTCNVKKMTELMKELRRIEPTVEKYHEYLNTVKSIEDLKELSKENDPEIAEMAQMELEEIRGKDEQII